MSVDWQLCITHENPPHFTSAEVAAILRCLDELGLLENLKFECHHSGDYDPDDREKLESVDAVSDWLASTRDDRFWLSCEVEFGVLGNREKCDRLHPVLSKLMDEMMDASEAAVLAGGTSPAYPPNISALGIAFNLEGTHDTDKFLEYLRGQPTFSALMAALADALGRPFEARTLEHIEYLRIRPEAEILGRIHDDMQGDWAETMPDAYALVEPRLKAPEKGNVAEDSGAVRENWIVSEVIGLGDKEWLIAYDNTPECWVFERKAGAETWALSYYRNSFYGVLDLIQYECQKRQ